jgi:hypothetical protein
MQTSTESLRHCWFRAWVDLEYEPFAPAPTSGYLKEYSSKGIWGLPSGVVDERAVTRTQDPLIESEKCSVRHTTWADVSDYATTSSGRSAADLFRNTCSRSWRAKSDCSGTAVDLLRIRYCWRIHHAGMEAVMSLVNADWRVRASGVPANQAPRRMRFMAAAVSTCCRCVLARPM